MNPIIVHAIQMLQAFGVYDNFVRFIIGTFALVVVFAGLNYFRNR